MYKMKSNMCKSIRPGAIPTPESNDDSDTDSGVGIGIICSSFWWSRNRSRNRGDWNRNRSRNRGDWNRNQMGPFHVKSPRVPHDPSQMFPKKLLKYLNVF